MSKLRGDLAMKVAHALYDELEVWWRSEGLTREEVNFAVGTFMAACAVPAERQEIEAYYLAAHNTMEPKT